MEEKFIRRFESFQKSLDSFAGVRNRDITDDFVLSGTVQKFTITFDIAWKVMKDILIQLYGVSDFATGSPRETLKKSMACNIISEDTWIDMMSDRNLLSHDYDGTIVKEKITIIIGQYLPLLERFADKAKELIDNSANS
ncbi:MAG: nucleotidyltransferase substrate binding protein [Saccharofermentans sp.]|nr:nucleotidyltransferase substrate binding protein [Saccharofermentans sp.]